MQSLTAHLRQADNHARLAFRPDCPICRRERLAGELCTHPLISPRALAAITVGALAVSAASPPLAIAGEPDQEQTGTAPANPSPSEDSAQNPNLDPGGPTTGVPASTPGAQPPATSQPDDDAVDPEPVKDTAPPVADAGDGVSDPDTSRQSLPVTAKPGQPAQPNSGADEPSSGPPPTAAQPAPHVDPPPSGRDRHPGRQTPRPAPPAPAVNRTGTLQVPPMELPPAAVAAVNEMASAPARSTKRARGHATSQRRTHMVVPGESLWSIARAALGGEPSNASIAREVNRLWDLNRRQIATGDPDLLPVGTKLRLP